MEDVKVIDGKEYYYISFDKYETELDENNIKHRIEYVRNEHFKICKKITSIVKVEKKTVRVKKGVYERSKWKSFGIENNDNVTTLGDEYSLDFVHGDNKTTNDKKEMTVNKKEYKDKNRINEKYDGLILLISNFPTDTSRYDLYTLLSSHGCLEAFYMPTDMITKQFKGYCFALYDNKKMCNKMYNQLNTHLYGYSRLVAEIK